MNRFICGFEIADSVCIHDEWHEGGHVMVDVEELAAA